MNLFLYDPPVGRHEYLTKMHFDPMRAYAHDSAKPVTTVGSVSDARNGTVLVSADHLDAATIATFKNNNCKIVGFSVTDSSYVAEPCRHAAELNAVDLMFMATGIQNVNHGFEMELGEDLEPRLIPRQFLPEEDWLAFEAMNQAGRLQSLPYVHWDRQPACKPMPWASRSKKVLIRGGHHMRRFLLALRLIEYDLLDCNSAMMTYPYFEEGMRADFRYCDHCRSTWKKHRHYPWVQHSTEHAACVHAERVDVTHLGPWNNRCPQSFFTLAGRMGLDRYRPQIESLLNGVMLSQGRHLEMLDRMAFTTDLKWIFSIYAPQRYWDAAMAGCVNVLPTRTIQQTYFPEMREGDHYLTFREDLESIPDDFSADEGLHNHISANAMALYHQWIAPSRYSINTNLIRHIFERIKEFAR